MKRRHATLCQGGLIDFTISGWNGSIGTCSMNFVLYPTAKA